MNGICCAAQLAIIVLLIASSTAAPLIPQDTEYPPSTVTGLLQDLKTNIRFGTNGDDFEFDPSIHPVLNSISSGTSRFLLRSTSKSARESSPEYSQFKGDAGGVPQTKSDDGHVSHVAAAIPSAPEYQSEHEQNDDNVNTGPEISTPEEHEISSGLLKSIPDDDEVHLGAKQVPSASKVRGHKVNIGAAATPKRGLVVPEAEEEWKAPNKLTTSNSAPFDESSKAPSVTAATEEKAPDQNSISQEDYVHAFMNGLVPTAGIAKKKPKQSVISEDTHNFNPIPAPAQVQASAHAPGKNSRVNVASSGAPHSGANSLEGSSTVSENGLEFTSSSSSVPKQVQANVQPPVANPHGETFSTDPAHFEATPSSTQPVPAHSPEQNSAQPPASNSHAMAFSTQSTHFKPPAQTRTRPTRAISVSLGSTKPHATEQVQVADQQPTTTTSVFGVSDPKPEPLKSEHKEMEKKEHRKCVTNTQGVRHCSS